MIAAETRNRTLQILILKPSSLGDVVQAVPVLRLLKQHWPESQIFWWLEASLTGLLEEDPDLAGIIPFDRESWRRPSGWWQGAQTIRFMRQRHFDLVVDLQGLFRSSMVAWLANGAFTIGVDDPREGARAFYDVAVRRPTSSHAIDWYLEVLRHLNVPVHSNFDWLPARSHTMKELRRKWPVDDHRWIVVQPGARWETKRWPVDYFSRAVNRLSRTRPRFRFAIMGGPADSPFAAEIMGGNPDGCLDLTGKTSLPEMVEWIRACDLMLTNDTGPMHVAAAIGRPVVALFGPTNPHRTGPYGQLQHVLRSDVPCAPCLREYCMQSNRIECLTSIAPEAACELVERILPP